MRAKHVSTMHRGEECRESDGESPACVLPSRLRKSIKFYAYLCTLRTVNQGGFHLARLPLAANSLHQASLLFPRHRLCQMLRCQVTHTCSLLYTVPVFQLTIQKILIREDYLVGCKAFWDLTPTCKGSNLVCSRVARHLQMRPLGPLHSWDKARQVADSLTPPT